MRDHPSCLVRHALYGPIVTSSLARVAMLGIAVISLSVHPGALRAQATWQSNGSGVIYAPAGVNVGIGTATPTSPEGWGPAVILSGNVPTLYLNNTAPGGGSWNLRSGVGANGHEVLAIRDTTAFADRLWIDSTGNVGIGATNPAYRLAVDGTIGAKEVIVTNTIWADYVFQPGYRLQGLDEIERYIQENRHLPGIPTEETVKEKGVSIGEMQAKLLAKVEELTLHVIELDKQNKALKAKMARLEAAASGRQ
ncbi:MAG: hypothetical protein LC130_16805 [Bryobacterales bacterium]|nr:hypothetical protein [Bryobacterales bacterium]